MVSYTKKLIGVLLAGTMAMSLLAGCGDKTEEKKTDVTNEDTGKEDAGKEDTGKDTKEKDQADGFVADESLEGVDISFLNSKGEIQEALEEMAVTFGEETGINVDVIACGTGEVPYTKITSAYNAGTAPTMAMLDPTDIEALVLEYGQDLSDETWTELCTPMEIEGKFYSFPFCIEGRGLIYNKTRIEDTLGEEFDPDAINSLDTLSDLLAKLREKGMESPVVLSKEDWSLGNHQLGYIYDTMDGTTEGSATVISSLKDGSLKPLDYERYNQFLDTMDLLMEYNINGEDPLGALYEQDPIFLVDGDAAIWPNGCWAWANLAEAGAETGDEFGFIPFVLGNDTSDFPNTGIQAGASKHVMIDKVQASEEQILAAKEFLNWMVYSESGQQALVEDCAIIPSCSNNTFEPKDPLGKDIKTKMGAGKTYSSWFIAPSDHWSVMGAAMQKYIAGESSREELAGELEKYWNSQE